MKQSNLAERWSTWSPQLKSLLRIIAALLFMQSGTMKLIAFPMGIPPDGGTVEFLTQAWFAGILETFGGLLIAIGLFTRPVALILAGEMAVAYFQFHAAQSFWPMLNGGTDAMLYCFLWLYYSAAGAGIWSLDAMLAKRRQLAT